MVGVSEIIEFIKKSDQKTLNELVEEIKKVFKIEEVAISSGTKASSEEKSKDKEDPNFNIKLTSVGSEKIKVYGAVMDAINKKNTGEQINIIGAKEIAEEAAEKRGIILANISKEDAKKIEEQLKGIGAGVEIEEIK